MSSQVAVVIGAGALGRATAAVLADSGLTVVVVDRTQDALRDLPGSIRSEVADIPIPRRRHRLSTGSPARSGLRPSW